MAVLAYNANSVRHADPPEDGRRQVAHSIDGQPGLYLIVRDSGTRSWAWRYTAPNGKRRQKVFADLKASGKSTDDAMTLADAAEWVSDRRTVLRVTGEDPFAGSARPRSNEETDANSTRALFEKFVAWMEGAVADGLRSKRTLDSYRRMLLEDRRGDNRNEFESLWPIPPTEVEKSDVSACLELYEKRGVRVAMNRAHSAVLSAFDWAAGRGHFGLSESPLEGMAWLYKEPERKRVLTPEEIAVAWSGVRPGGIVDADPETTGIVRMLMLTGQRSGEVRAMRLEHIDEGAALWIMPDSARKGTRPKDGTAADHIVPLSEPALEIVEHARAGRSTGLVFTGSKDPTRPRTGQSISKAFERLCERAEIEPKFVPHDLRRTVRTGLSDLGVDPVVCEKILGHALPKILRTYDRSPQIEARRDALNRWGAFVLECVEGGE